MWPTCCWDMAGHLDGTQKHVLEKLVLSILSPEIVPKIPSYPLQGSPGRIVCCTRALRAKMEGKEPLTSVVSNMCYFHPIWGRFPINIFRWVETTNQLNHDRLMAKSCSCSTMTHIDVDSHATMAEFVATGNNQGLTKTWLNRSYSIRIHGKKCINKVQ